MLFFGPRGKRSLRKRVASHLGGSLADAHTFTHRVQAVERVNLQLTLDQWLERDGAGGELVGFSGDQYLRVGLSDVAASNLLSVAPVQREPLERAPGEFLHGVSRGVYLLRHDGRP